MVGLGPGDASLLAPLARTALERAAVVAGYSTYLDLVPPELLAGKEVVATGMMGEVERCALAVESALAGRDTAVVSGGDSGVYGMAGLVLEMLETRRLLDRVDFEVVPGIPAVIGAAALLGAPLTHDFACVSLSDLLTPWEVIEKRLEAAASADFVLALYNPRSRRRSGLLERALAIVARHRAPETPVGFVRQAWREGQNVRVATLGEADPAWADMLTIVVVGNASTRMAGEKMLTPRGYAGKYGLE
ncbi:putative cobalt-factor III C(17)-methyltransferase [Fundidesulfovibrio magnetotacticus]|uniref:Putative cobalt-factor III C(17)-methyltransferase n=1 Tax=Fundidesulfovibrio magnetotacticus TaxID=2730080 RepID=A0A6V8LTZ0_9BACT|nr:precorrin-3B C(17)-methyltransferase [Fundidesulfovibrio magnetotacticus]GFK95942.1 putative cobalt-factor III C(17)-methyltransferase [Fundidesulfovibrio magnetotacticus]